MALTKRQLRQLSENKGIPEDIFNRAFMNQRNAGASRQQAIENIKNSWFTTAVKNPTLQSTPTIAYNIEGPKRYTNATATAGELQEIPTQPVITKAVVKPQAIVVRATAPAVANTVAPKQEVAVATTKPQSNYTVLPYNTNVLTQTSNMPEPVQWGKASLKATDAYYVAPADRRNNTATKQSATGQWTGGKANATYIDSHGVAHQVGPIGLGDRVLYAKQFESVYKKTSK